MAVKSDNYWLAKAQNAASVTPSDSTDLDPIAYKGIWVGGTGNISLVTVQGQTVSINSIAAGTLIPIQVARVRSTGTTATAIVALS